MVGPEEVIGRLKEIEKIWHSLTVVPEDLAGSVKGLTKTEITVALVRIQSALEITETINPIYLYQISTQVTNLETYVKQHIPSNVAAHLPGFVGIIYNLDLIIDVVTIDSNLDGADSPGLVGKLSSKLLDSLSRAQLASQFLENTRELIQKNNVASSEITKILGETQDATTKIQERDRTTVEATSRIVETEKKSLTLVSQLESQLAQVAKSSADIVRQQGDLSKLSEALSGKLSEAQSLLEDANRLGLAGAFKTRKEQLSGVGGWWITLFLLSVGGLSYLAYDSLLKVSGADWHFLLFRLPFSAPLVWLGWFSVKQYGYNRRLQEDYSFKVASAMSFQGYKNEVNADPELLKLLRHSAIENFSANPIRIYDDPKNHGSPLHELLENVNETKFNRVIDLVKAFSPVKK